MLSVARGARTILFILTVVSTTIGVWFFIRTIAAGGLNFVEALLVPIFGLLFGWIAFSFWTATLGLIETLARPQEGLAGNERLPDDAPPLPQTAILMPIYNESPTSVFAGVRAMMKSLGQTGRANAFEIYILSDTTNPDVWLEEERAWARLVAERHPACQVFYRRRPKNSSRKAGNIADFCRRWGSHYKYMVVLDADSVMAGNTVVEMVRRMEADPRLGILQAPPTPVNRVSLFARLQQFASRLYGPIFIQGFASWARFDGNYWGHNAIIRVEPFTSCCSLPVLPGAAPLGGEILSHDFVEAALMARAGWKVALAQDLGGSYEECPTTLLDYAKRDQRWCQGNMQHIRLVFSENFRPISRLHLGMGVFSYLSSPLWLAFMILSALAMGVDAIFGTDSSHWGGSALAIFAVTMTMLLLPKFYSLIALARDKSLVEAFGGWGRAIGSVLLEILVSVAVAPLMMLFHTQFVVATFLGRKVSWNAQNRDESGSTLADAVAVYWPHTLLGLALAAAVYFFAPATLIWFSPLIVGLALSIPLSLALDSAWVGRRLAKLGLLLIPEETATPELLLDQRKALETERAAAERIERSELFDAALEDPVFHALHVSILHATESHRSLDPKELALIEQAFKEQGSAGLTVERRRALLCDADALRELHIWTRSRPDRARAAVGARVGTLAS